MLNAIIDWSLRHRVAVVGLTLAAIFAGILALRSLDIDAFPDTTPVQVQVNTVAPAFGPEEIERQITSQVEQAIGGLPKVAGMRSISKFGLSQVVVTFADGTDIWFARQLIAERLGTVELPGGIGRPEMGPVATGLGEIFHYIVRSQDGDPTTARTVQDWVIKPALQTVPGVAEVNAWGGCEKQYEIRLDPERLVARGLSLDTVLGRVRAGNVNVGGGVAQRGAATLVVQGLGRVAGTDEIGAMVVGAKDGVAIHLRDVAEIGIGNEIRRGAVTADGRGEAVLGLGFLLMGENSHVVTSRLKAKLDELRPFLPPGIEVEVVYDRTELIDHVIDTVRRNLFEGGLLVIAVLFLFLGNLRAGLIVALAIPLSMMVAFDGMLRFGISASLLSLGALDFGLVVDSSVIMVENAVRRLNHPRERHRSHLEVVRDAAIEVRKPTMFGELIIIMVYLPILTLEGIEGKLFQPMALTVVFALAGSMILSLTLMPVLASWCLRRSPQPESDPWLVRLAVRVYAPCLRLALRHRLAVVGASLASVLVAVLLFRGLGAEFIPRLSEGGIVANIVRLPGTSLETSTVMNGRIERLLLHEFPDEIRHVWSRSGTAEVATDPMGIELTDVFVSFQPRERWTKATTQAGLTERIAHLVRDLPGQSVVMTQPIEMRMNEMISGARGDVAVKLFGDDLDLLREKAGEIEVALYGVTGSDDVSVEQTTGQPSLRIHAEPAALARHGIPTGEVMHLVETIGGVHLGEVVEGQLRFPLVARLPAAIRDDPDRLAEVPILATGGERLPLSAVATIAATQEPLTITREWGQRRIVIQCNVKDRDVASFVSDAQAAVAKEVPLPPGRWRIEWGGQFENLERARARLALVVPIALLSIFLLLRWSLGSTMLACLVYTAVPVAAVGGVAGLWLRGMPFSISAGVGFIALAGVAVLNGLVMVTFIRQLRRQGTPLHESIVQGSLIRLRPVLMTALVAALGFVPMALATGMGAEVQRPLATVVIAGILSSTLLTLFLIPVLYGWFEPRTLDEPDPAGDPPTAPGPAPATKENP
ncbi:MAG: efflux RND transporter permease subunit [Caulobacterales bacterium]|nr:efflux RND transporter permease subunit [Caulobacterales bacterium]